MLLALLAIGCAKQPQPYQWNLPQGFAPPLVPAENPMTQQKVKLGRYLYYEKNLSGNQSYACANCHLQRLAFSDGRVAPVGSTGDVLPRNAMPLINAAYGNYFMWANPLLNTLEEQILVPMFSDAPIEMGMSEKLSEIIARLSSDSMYMQMFHDAFPDQANPFTVQNIIYAITSFERTVISANSPYDQYNNGNTAAMSDSAIRGMNAFNTEKFDCYHCHAGITFTTTYVSQNAPMAPRDFRNDGIYNIDGMGAYPPNNTGLYDFTQFGNDMGKFKVPTLRNVELTAPYFHDGSAATLDDVLQSYAHGGRLIPTGQPNAGDGSTSPHRDPLVKGFAMTAQEEADMIEFLKSLTDHDFVNNKDYGNPNCPSDLPTGCPSAVPSYAQAVAPIVQSVCGKCHAPGQIAANRPMVDYASTFALKDAAYNQLSNCNMPPSNADPQLGEGDRSTLLSWILCGAPNN